MIDVTVLENFKSVREHSDMAFSPEVITGVLAEMEQFRHLVSSLTSEGQYDASPEDPRELPHRLHLIAVGVLDCSICLRNEELQAACNNAVSKLRPDFGHITSDQDWDDARQETWVCLRKQMWNLAGKPIEDLDEYARRVMRNLLTAWRRRADRKKSLSAVPGGEESLAVEPDGLDADAGFDREGFLAYLDARVQPNPDLPMSKVFRAFDAECLTRAKVAARLGVSETEVTKQLKAIRAWREQRER